MRNIETFYGRINAIKGISLDVQQGSIVTVFGGNGAGKSTVLKTIAGLLDKQPHKGTIEFMGRPIHKMDAEKIVRVGISYVPEAREVFPELSVKENLRMGGYVLQNRKAIKDELDRVMSFFPVLKERKDQVAGTLSGGEQQMLAIARGLMAKPKMLMLDEPSLGLAPVLVKEIFEIINKINEGGVTVLLVEQNARMALKVAHYGYVLENGRIVLGGTGDELRKNKDIQEFYLGTVKSKVLPKYKRKKRWR